MAHAHYQVISVIPANLAARQCLRSSFFSPDPQRAAAPRLAIAAFISSMETARLGWPNIPLSSVTERAARPRGCQTTSERALTVTAALQAARASRKAPRRCRSARKVLLGKPIANPLIHLTRAQQP